MLTIIWCLMCIQYRLLNLRARLVETLIFKVRPKLVIAGSLAGFDTQVQSAERAHGGHAAGMAGPGKGLPSQLTAQRL